MFTPSMRFRGRNLAVTESCQAVGLRAEDATIRTFPGELDHPFGSPVAWLKANGLRESSIESLRREMLG